MESFQKSKEFKKETEAFIKSNSKIWKFLKIFIEQKINNTENLKIREFLEKFQELEVIKNIAFTEIIKNVIAA